MSNKPMQSRLPRKIEIHEVVLRDGIQNEKKLVSTDQKVKLINRLTEWEYGASRCHPLSIPVSFRRWQMQRNSGA
jgi:hypothetical protein